MLLLIFLSEGGVGAELGQRGDANQVAALHAAVVLCFRERPAGSGFAYGDANAESRRIHGAQPARVEADARSGASGARAAVPEEYGDTLVSVAGHRPRGCQHLAAL